VKRDERTSRRDSDVRPARLAIVLVVVSAWSLHAQWDHRYPPVKGIVNGVYLEEFELPPMGAGPTDPAPAPDGQSVAIAARGWLWLLDLKTGAARRLTRGPAMDSRPAWAMNAAEDADSSGSRLSCQRALLPGPGSASTRGTRRSGARHDDESSPILPRGVLRQNSIGVVRMEVFSETSPFSCPLDATRGGKDRQSAAQGENEDRAIFIG